MAASGRAAEARYFRSILWQERGSQPEARRVQARLLEPLGGDFRLAPRSGSTGRVDRLERGARGVLDAARESEPEEDSRLGFVAESLRLESRENGGSESERRPGSPRWSRRGARIGSLAA